MKLALTNFGNHEATNIELPETGVGLFTGPNGSGKSMIGEAIVWCLWSENIRTSRRGWSPAIPGTVVRMEVDGVVYERRRTKSGTTLTIDGEGKTRDNNVTVEQTFGSARLYLATRVFHRSLLVKFSNATDSERKGLIEFLLGASQFDTWHKQVRSELRVTKDRLLTETQKLARFQAELAAYEGELRVLRPPTKPKLSKAVKAARKYLEKPTPDRPSRPDTSSCDKARRRFERTGERLRNVRRARDEANGLVLQGKCPECGASTNTKRHKHTVVDLMGKVDELKVKKEKLAKRVERERSKLLQSEADYDQALHHYEEFKSTRQRAEYVVQRYREDLGEWKRAKRYYKHQRTTTIAKRDHARRDLNKIRSRILTLETRVRRLSDLARVYGPRGARVALLQEAFKVLSGVATKVCGEVYREPVYVEVRPSEALETVSLRIQLRDGQEISYRGLSEGERSLIDFSLLKALASIPTATTGAARLPLIYDDVTDAVDGGNKERLASFIRSEGRGDSVLVFSHDDSTRELFPAAITHKVSRGRVKGGIVG